MSTRHSIWYGEEANKSLHLYFELAERERLSEQGLAAPVYLAASRVDAKGTPIETSVRIRKELAEKLIGILVADNLREQVYKVL
jgi:hypothetical protein